MQNNQQVQELTARQELTYGLWYMAHGVYSIGKGVWFVILSVADALASLVLVIWKALKNEPTRNSLFKWLTVLLGIIAVPTLLMYLIVMFMVMMK